MSMRLGSQTASVMNHIMSAGEQVSPEIGMGITILRWTDRTAATVLELTTTGRWRGKEMVIQEDTAIRADKNGMSESQVYSYYPNPEGAKHTVRLLKAGWKIFEGKDYTGKNYYTSGLGIGYRRHYHDYSF